MYLSRVKVDTKNRQKISDLTHLGAYHSWVEDSFPQEVVKGERKRHLWRLDQVQGKEYLLVLSADQPNMNRLEKYGVPGSAQSKTYDQFLSQIQTGRVMRFRLTANPVHRVTEPGEKAGKVYPHITIAQQEKWLIDRAEKNGFTLLTTADGYQFDVVGRDRPQLLHKGQRRVKLNRVSYEGLLKVSDADLFKKLLVNGIGKEKAYGMGLMTVIPVHEKA